MPIQYKPTKHAWYPQGDSLTEPEHLDSCDINKMVKNASRGLHVRGGSEPKYGYDDTTLDSVQFRIQKEQLERELSVTAKQNEFSPDELKHVPSHIQKKFGFKTKKADQKPSHKNDELNDDKKAGTPLLNPDQTPKP